jgi:chaperonin GroES
MSLTPLHGKIVVKRFEKETKTPGGLIIPTDITNDKPPEGVVVAIGSGTVSSDGTVTPIKLSIGDHVIFGRYIGTEVIDKEDGETYLLMLETDILGVFRDEPSSEIFGSIPVADGKHLTTILDFVIFKFCSTLSASSFIPKTDSGIIVTDKRDFQENSKDQWVEILVLGPNVDSELRNYKFALIENAKWTNKVKCFGTHGDHLWRSEQQYVKILSSEYHNPYSF